MPAFCCVLGCGNRGERDRVRFFRIPAVLLSAGKSTLSLSQERQKKWVNVLKRGNLSKNQLKNWRVCEKHFISGQPAHVLDTNNPDWVPSQNLGYKTYTSIDRYKCTLRRRKAFVPDQNIDTFEQKEVAESNDNLRTSVVKTKNANVQMCELKSTSDNNYKLNETSVIDDDNKPNK